MAINQAGVAYLNLTLAVCDSLDEDRCKKKELISVDKWNDAVQRICQPPASTPVFEPEDTTTQGVNEAVSIPPAESNSKNVIFVCTFLIYLLLNEM